MLRTVAARSEWNGPVTALSPLLADRNLHGLVARAGYHRIANMVHASIRGLEGLDPEALHILEHARAASVARHMRAMLDLAWLADALQAARVPWLLFKGPVLAELFYPAADLRSYHDLDVLVPARSFSDVVGLLEKGGAHLKDRNWNAISRDVRGQVHPILPLGTEADLHWDLLIDATLRQSANVDTAGVLQRAVPAHVGGRTVPTMDPEDTLLHLCLHAGFGGGHRLVWLKDVERVVATWPPRWPVVIERAERWGLRLLIGVVLRRTQTVTGASIPDEVVSELMSAAARPATRAVDWLLPVERSFGHYAGAAMWTRMLRDDAHSSASALLAKTRTVRLTGPQVRRALRRAREGAFSDGPLSPAHASGNASDRETYLRRVSRRQ